MIDGEAVGTRRTPEHRDAVAVGNLIDAVVGEQQDTVVRHPLRPLGESISLGDQLDLAAADQRIEHGGTRGRPRVGHRRRERRRSHRRGGRRRRSGCRRRHRRGCRRWCSTVIAPVAPCREEQTDRDPGSRQELVAGCHRGLHSVSCLPPLSHGPVTDGSTSGIEPVSARLTWHQDGPTLL